jgi:putative phosphoribosyl transferase
MPVQKKKTKKWSKRVMQESEVRSVSLPLLEEMRTLSGMRYRDRYEAGRALGERLAGLTGHPDLLVLGLPRGGVPVAWEVARRLGAPLDVFVVRKLGFPGHEELAMGAIASGGVRVLNPEVVGYGVDQAEIERVTEREERELERRERVFRGDRPPMRVLDRAVVLVDDGLATGSTMRAAVRALRQERAGRVIVAVPVAAPSVCADMEAEADEVVCATTPEPFRAVGLWYEDFAQTTDQEVRELLSRPTGNAEAARGGESWT